MLTKQIVQQDTERMNNLGTLLMFNTFPVRVKNIVGVAWFCAKDVCNVLSLKNSRQVISVLDERDVRSMDTVDSCGRKNKMTFISKAAVQIIIMRSDKPQAKQFQRWIVEEVLPSIEETGSYTLPGLKQNTPESNDNILLSKNDYIELINENRLLLKEKLEILTTGKRTRKPYSESEKATMIKMNDLGYSKSKIAKRVGRTAATVGGFLSWHKTNISTHSRRDKWGNNR